MIIDRLSYLSTLPIRPFVAGVGYCLLLWAAIEQSELFAQEPSAPDLLVISETYWGFDGRVQPQQFVPLSIQVKNLGATPWQGRLELRRVVRGERQFGATLVEDLSLPGEETRWIQLSPYVVDDLEDWELRWGEGKKYQIVLPPVIKGERPTVLIYDSDAVGHSSSVFKRMPEERFPTSVTATEALRGVILDSAPFWQGARARAFHDWLLLGGRVYLLQNKQGEFPEFPAALAFLNSDQSQFSIGSGIVKKMPRKVEQYSLDQAREEIFNDDWSITEQKQEQVLRDQMMNSTYGGWMNGWSQHDVIFKELTEFAKFRRNWWLIYLSAFAYLAALYPGCYSVGVHQKNVRRFYLIFLTSAGCFALVFSLLGQVGGRTENRVRTVSLARSLDEGSFAVTGWSILANVFAANHSLTAPGTGVAFSTTREAEHVNGEMNPGTGGKVTFQMLPDSKRTLLYKSRIRTNRLPPRLISDQGGESRISNLSIDISNSFSEDPLFALAVSRGMVYELELKGTRLEQTQVKVPVSLTAYLQRPFDFGMNVWGGPVKKTKDDKETENFEGLKRYHKLIRPLVGNSFGLVDEMDARTLKMGDQQLRLFVLTAASSEFQVESNDFTDQEGAVLFTYDLRY